MDWPEHVGGAPEVVERQLEEKRLVRLAFGQLLADRRVVSRAVLDGVLEDRWIRCESRRRQLVDVTLERAAIEQVASDVVEPQALAQVVEQFGRFHNVTSRNDVIKIAMRCPPWLSYSISCELR